MFQYISHIFDGLPVLLAHGGYWLTFIIVILEGVPVIGSFVPGHVVIIAAGFLAKLGILSLPWVIVVTLVAAVCGDFIGFYIGRRYGYALLSKYGKYIFIKEDHIEKARKVIDGHTGKALVFGKFSPLTRPMTPFLVGASGVSIQTFSFFNIIGAASWVVLSVLLGYVFGASYHVAAQFLGKFIVIALVATVLIVWGYRFVNTRFHVFRKYELFVLALNLLSLWGLAKTIQDVVSTEPFMVNFDVSISAFMHTLVSHSPWLETAASWVSTIGSTGVTASLGVIIGLYFLYKKKWRRAAIMLLTIASTSFFLFVIKEIVMRPRPSNALQHLLDPSFPSGHTGLAAAFFVALAYVFAPKIHNWVKRELFIVLCVLAVIAVGLSRVIMNVHWASDVIAGWSLGVFLATGSILLVRYVGALFIKGNK